MPDRLKDYMEVSEEEKDSRLMSCTDVKNIHGGINKKMKKLLIIGTMLALAAAMVVPVAAFGATGDTTVTANFESITITAPTGKTNMALAASTADQSLVSTAGVITSSLPYNVTAKDKMDVSKDAGDAGYLTSWDGDSWNNGVKIAAPVKVGSGMATYGQAAGNLSATDRNVIVGAPAGNSVGAQITVTVTTAGGDTALTAPNVYRIVITFTVSSAT
jgi:hypothetical protein